MKSLLSRWGSVIALNLAVAVAAQAAPYGMYPAQGQVKTLAANAASGPLLYHGGPVLSSAKVYAVFWGNNVASETQQKIGSFYSNVLDSGYVDWLKEYNTNLSAVDGRAGTNQSIGRGSYGGSFMIEPSAQPSGWPFKVLKDSQIQQELEAQIAAGKLPTPDDNSLYMVYFPKGIGVQIDNAQSCATFCAYHYNFQAKSGAWIYYGVMPVCSFGCDVSTSKFDSLTVVSSHELIEAITDPRPVASGAPGYPDAWNTASGEEIGDVCVGQTAKVTGHGITSAVQQEWDNSINGCAAGPWTQFQTLASVVKTAVSDVPARPTPLMESLQNVAGSSWDGR